MAGGNLSLQPSLPLLTSPAPIPRAPVGTSQTSPISPDPSRATSHRASQGPSARALQRKVRYGDKARNGKDAETAATKEMVF